MRKINKKMHNGKFLGLDEEELRIHIYLEQKKAYLKHNNKTKKSRTYIGVNCYLTSIEVQRLLKKANITIYQVGKKNHEYQLSRFNDKGHYEISNCEFITAAENRKQVNEKEKDYSHQIEVVVDDVKYRSIQAAVRATGLSTYEVKKAAGLVTTLSEEEKRANRLKKSSIIFRNITYATISEAARENNTSAYKVKKEIDKSS